MQAEPKTLPPSFGRPHVIILGAGASRATCPEGDKKGHILPLMNDLIDVLGMERILRDYGIDRSDQDFEQLYSDLHASGSQAELVACIEQCVFDYFSGLELPDRPTLYDHLVLSLRPKDLIATFNWDPLLWQALRRDAHKFGQKTVPCALSLHGNVALGYCDKHTPMTIGSRDGLCRKCASPLQPTRLLYPVKEKGYADDPVIKQSWEMLQRYLKEAYLFTIFGYRAPETDVEAIELMKNAWGDPESRAFEEVEIIDIRGSNELRESWSPFICRDHCDIGIPFYESLAARHARRSCEDFREASLQGDPQHEHSIPRDAGWGELKGWITPLLQQERESTD